MLPRRLVGDSRVRFLTYVLSSVQRNIGPQVSLSGTENGIG